MKKITNYILLSKVEAEEKEKKLFQEECSHAFWSTRCGVCSKILASDHHINCHTRAVMHTKNKIGIYLLGTDKEDDILYRIQTLKSVKEENNYTELVLLVNTLDELQLYSEFKIIDVVKLKSLEEQIKHYRKFRKEDIETINLIIPSQNLDKIEIDYLKEKCEKLKIISNVLPKQIKI